ncbi:uncharacterized protein VP01_1393g9 [Puccinia sorghi]|uniref:Uncharacterized protein n=1 Tax=Puccinia sorghi TaxID=27349 RepID=A0A0L6VLQ1_9BASI|nr:uncharacterized protein VP01_1393g9 [Puccinia sorghi]
MALEDFWYPIQHQVKNYCGYHSQVKCWMRSGVNNNEVSGFLTSPK